MDRRDFVKNAMTAGGIAAAATGLSSTAGCGQSDQGDQGDQGDQDSAAAGGANPNPKIKWLLVSSFPKSLDTIYGAAEVLQKRIHEITGGQFEIEVAQANEYVKGTEVLQAVRDGNAEMGHSASYYYRGLNSALVFDTAVPFGLNARQQMAWLEQAGGRELLQEKLFNDLNVVGLPGGNTGTQMGGWFRKEIKSLADLNGLKMRIPGLGGEVMRAMGVSAVTYGGKEIYTNLQTKNILAAEWVGPYDDEKLGFHEVAENYYFPGWWEPGPSLSFYINKTSWDALPSTYQAALKAASTEASVNMMSSYDAKNPAALKSLVEKGVNVLPFPDDIMLEAEKQTALLLKAECKSNPVFAEIYAHWKAFKDESSEWFRTAEQTYSNFANRNQ